MGPATAARKTAIISDMTKFFIASFLVALTLAPLARAEEETPLNSLYTDPQTATRAPATSEQAQDPAFVVAPPDRSPASGAAKAVAHGQSAARRSKLPLDIINGFELRVQFKNLNSTFWVVERQGRYDMIYANSGGSQSSVSLSQPSFGQLQKIAGSFKPFEENISKCKSASLQLHVVAAKQKERTVTLCANSKAPAAQQLLRFSDQLAMMVR